MGLGLKKALSAAADWPRPVAALLKRFAVKPMQATLKTCVAPSKRENIKVGIDNQKQTFATLVKGHPTLAHVGEDDHDNDGDDL